LAYDFVKWGTCEINKTDTYIKTLFILCQKDIGLMIIIGQQEYLIIIRKHCSKIACNDGSNTLRNYAVSPGFVLEKLVIYPEGKKPANSYLGPSETFYVRN